MSQGLSSASAAPQEVELKMALGTGAAEALASHPPLAGLAPQRQRLANVYFDTPERSLERHRIALRLRADGERCVQTVKTAGSGRGGLHSRGEWEVERERECLDTHWLARLGIAPFDDAALRESLMPVYRTDFDRRSWQVAFKSSHIELALDEGEIVAGERRTSIFELELELKSGEEADLWALVETLAEHCPMRPANASKAARAVALRDGQPALPGGDSAELEAEACLERAIAALDAFQDSGDNDYLLAARRALTLLSHHDDAVVAGAASRLVQALTGSNWLDQRFGQYWLVLMRALRGR
ncbi:CYTH domain-containing protein [Kushneria aurantia]|uniref:Inorganic triphosphatase n=1 Tax=Kushneria aurantia TaxID=504092 RepID=A0ABV6G3H4_9GAMM|nr:CYTH domain-containing protein [Kushneria aurantia]